MSVGPEKTFAIHVADEDIDFLKKKLDLVRLPDEPEGAGWDYGVPLAHVKRLVEYWKTGFDWRKHEAEINKLPQFTRDIPVDGHGTLNVHYVHQRSARANAIPLLFVHGWPGHFLEVRKLLPLLTADVPGKPSFHVVAYSLPGFGFSEAPKKTGFDAKQFAEVGNKLMVSLGYDHYVAQGGDWGHMITGTIATHYAHTHLKGWLSNMPVAKPPTPLAFPRLFLTWLLTPYSAKEKDGLSRAMKFSTVNGGYFHEQATRPQTLGYTLADSPAGLLAWIYEKLVTWTDEYPWTDDEVLEWVSIYWFSRSGPAASLRIYKEVSKSYTRSSIAHIKWTSIPLGFSHFPKELTRVPGTWTRTLGNVVFESEHERGGHFAAHEQPEDIADDLRAMFGKGGPAYGIVPGKNGYA